MISDTIHHPLQRLLGGENDVFVSEEVLLTHRSAAPHPDNPDHILESAAADKIRNYRDAYRRNRHVAFLPACMSTSGRIHGELLRLIFFLSNKQAEDYFEALGCQPHSQEFVTVAASSSSKPGAPSGLACAQAVALRGAPTTARRHVAAPRRPPPLHMAYDDHDRNVSHIHGFA